MNSIEKLSIIFKNFPGIGPRQAKRFVYFLLSQNADFINELLKEIEKLRSQTSVCPDCFRFFTKDNFSNFCDICARSDTDKTSLMIVSKDVDIDAVQKSDIYKGRFFVLGSTLPFLEKNPSDFIRDKELLRYIEKNKNTLKELIFALPLTPEGENTRRYIVTLIEKYELKHTTFGRGLSTGTEIEYSDSETIVNAFKNRF